MQDRNPDLWADVREHLPLLTRRRWYSQVPRGYARGRQPVEYVRNIRSYYDILLWKAPDVELAIAPQEEAPLADPQDGAAQVVRAGGEAALVTPPPSDATPPQDEAAAQAAPTGELAAPPKAAPPTASPAEQEKAPPPSPPPSKEEMNM